MGTDAISARETATNLGSLREARVRASWCNTTATIDYGVYFAGPLNLFVSQQCDTSPTRIDCPRGIVTGVVLYVMNEAAVSVAIPHL